MKKTPIYTYVGTNGMITSPVHLEGIAYMLKYKLEAEGAKYLTKDNETYIKTVVVPAEEVDEWKEVFNKVISK